MWIVALWSRRAACALADGDVIIEISLDTVDFLDRTPSYPHQKKADLLTPTRWRETQIVDLTRLDRGVNSRRCFSAPAARSLLWIGSCSKFWTDRGTSNVSSAANASALWQRSVFHERGGCTVRMTSLGKHPRHLDGSSLSISCHVNMHDLKSQRS